VTISVAAFVYYVAWVCVTVRAGGRARGGGARGAARDAPPLPLPLRAPGQPFLAPAHPAQALFPPRYLAQVLPAAALAGAVTVAGSFIGLVLLRARGGKPAAPAPAPAAPAPAPAARSPAAAPPAAAKKSAARNRKA